MPLHSIVWPDVSSPTFCRSLTSQGCLFEGVFPRDDTFVGRVSFGGVPLVEGHLFRDESGASQLVFASGTGRSLAFESVGGVLAYTGQVDLAGRYDGRGDLYEDGRLSYRGDFAHGEREGVGATFDPHGSAVYAGGWLRGAKDGSGFVYRNGVRVCEVHHSHGRPVWGRWYRDGVCVYEGQVDERHDGVVVPHGELGRAMDEAGSVLYEGAFVDGVPSPLFEATSSWNADARFARSLRDSLGRGDEASVAARQLGLPESLFRWQMPGTQEPFFVERMRFFAVFAGGGESQGERPESPRKRARE